MADRPETTSAPAGDQVEMTLTIKVGSATFSKTHTVGELKTMQANNITPFDQTVKCGICCAGKKGTAACIARCLYGDGKCCDGGVDNCS